MLSITPHEAIQLTATFAVTAEYLRSGDTEARIRARIYETASRIAFLRAYILAKNEDARPRLDEVSRPPLFARA